MRADPTPVTVSKDPALPKFAGTFPDAIRSGTEHPPDVMVTDRQSCPACGTALRTSVLGGLCPACVSRRTLRFSRVVPIADSPVANRLQPVVMPISGRMRVGDYEVESEIARGGMGVVYRARQLGLNRLVALKLLLAGQFADPVQVKRFRAEAAALARLNHPGIVPIYEVGEFEGRHFFSMRLIEGPSLAKAMPKFHLAASAGVKGGTDAAQRTAMRHRQHELARFMAEIARAVHYAHLRGVLHRDLKPGNVLLDSQGAPHVTDFGLARCMDAELDPGGSGLVFGTPAYMPPEQTVDPHNVSAVADVYSLGAIAYELLTGRPPFEAGTPVETVIQVREREAIRPCDLEPEIDRDLETIVLKCLDKDPGGRYGTALALAEDLERFVSGEPVVARPVSASTRAIRWTRRHPLVTALGTIVLLLLITLAIGGPVMALRIAEESRLKEEAKNSAQSQLRTAQLAQARAQRLRRDAIQREHNLDSVSAAADIGVTQEVINEAVAQLARFDVARSTERDLLPGQRWPVVVRPDFAEYYRMLTNGAVAAFAASDHRQLWIQDQLPEDSRPGYLRAAPDLRHLAVERGGHVVVLRTQDGSIAWKRPIANMLKFSVQGDWMLLQDARRNVLRVKTDTGEVLPFPDGAMGLDHEFAIMPEADRPIFVRVRAERLEFLDWERDQVVSTVEHSSSLSLVVWQDERVAASDVTGAVLVWHLPSRQPVVLRTRFRLVTALQFVPGTSLLFVQDNDGSVSCWDTDDGEAVLNARGFLPEQFSADGHLVQYSTGDQWGVTRLLRPAGRVRYRMGDEETSHVRQLVFSPDSRLLVAVTQGGVHVLNLASDRMPAFFPLFGAVRAWFASGDRELLVQGRDCVVRIGIQAESGMPKLSVLDQRPWPHGAWLEPGVFSAESETLWVPRVGVGLEPVPGSSATTLEPVAVSEVERALAVDQAGGWIVFRRGDGHRPALVNLNGVVREVPQFEGDFVPNVSPDGHWLLAASRLHYRMFSVSDWSLRRNSPISGGIPASHPPSAWSWDSRHVALYHDIDSIEIRDAQTWKELVRLTTPQPAGLTTLAFSPGGRWLAAGTDRGIVEVWDFKDLAQALQSMRLDLSLTVSPLEADAPALPLLRRAERIQLPPPLPAGYPVRDPAADPRQLDLTAHFTARLDKSWALADPNTQRDSLVHLPTGLQTFNGVLFDVRGVIQLAGERFETQSIQFPKDVSGIRVGMPVQRLHLVGATADGFDKLERGMVLAHVRMHYADGGTTEFPLRLGFELGDRWRRAHQPVSLKNAQVAWYGMNVATESAIPAYREVLYHSVLTNPSPERIVDRLDLVASGASPAPFVVALTVE